MELASLKVPGLENEAVFCPSHLCQVLLFNIISNSMPTPIFMPIFSSFFSFILSHACILLEIIAVVEYTSYVKYKDEKLENNSILDKNLVREVFYFILKIKRSLKQRKEITYNII